MARHKKRNSRPVGKTRRILAGLILVALIWPFYILAGRALCYIALRQIGGLTNTKIETESVSFRTNGSVLIKKLAISPLKQENGDNTILKADAVHARFSVLSFFLLNPQLKVIDVEDFVFDARYDLDADRWNLSGLKIMPPKNRPHKMPRIRLHSGILRYTKASNGNAEVAISLPLDAEFGADIEAELETEEGYGYRITTANQVSGLAAYPQKQVFVKTKF